MNPPIVEKLSDAPEVGDAVLMIAENFCIPVRNRERAWSVESIGGWNTKAETPAPLNFSVNSDPLPPPADWLSPRFVFAPTAEAAIEKYLSSEACPFGSVKLAKVPLGHSFTGNLGPLKAVDILIFSGADSVSSRLIGVGLDQYQTVAFHALLSEVIAYQTAERSGSRDSRIHRELGGER